VNPNAVWRYEVYDDGVWSLATEEGTNFLTWDSGSTTFGGFQANGNAFHPDDLAHDRYGIAWTAPENGIYSYSIQLSNANQPEEFGEQLPLVDSVIIGISFPKANIDSIGTYNESQSTGLFNGTISLNQGEGFRVWTSQGSGILDDDAVLIDSLVVEQLDSAVPVPEPVAIFGSMVVILVGATLKRG
jgi:hypothetical protein